MLRLVKINEQGRRIGESHPRAVLTDRDVDLLQGLLEEREALINELLADGLTPMQITAVLKTKGLTFRLLGLKFEVSKGHVSKIAYGKRRCQTIAVVRACP